MYHLNDSNTPMLSLIMSLCRCMMCRVVVITGRTATRATAPSTVPCTASHSTGTAAETALGKGLRHKVQHSIAPGEGHIALHQHYKALPQDHTSYRISIASQSTDIPVGTGTRSMRTFGGKRRHVMRCSPSFSCTLLAVRPSLTPSLSPSLSHPLSYKPLTPSL
jgi:hypothetical protein